MKRKNVLIKILVHDNGTTYTIKINRKVVSSRVFLKNGQPSKEYLERWIDDCQIKEEKEGKKSPKQP